MSADNWGVCPKCKKSAEKIRDREEKKLEESYGKIPADEWLRLRENLPSGEVDETTLREDYEMRIDEDGEFIVNYRAGCSVCGFQFKYTHTVEVLEK